MRASEKVENVTEREAKSLTLSSSWTSDTMLGRSGTSSRAASVVASLAPLTLLDERCQAGRYAQSQTTVILSQPDDRPRKTSITDGFVAQ